VCLTRLVGYLGDAEVGDERISVLIDEDIGRLDVAMYHARSVGVGERRSYLAEYRTDDWDWQFARLLHNVIQRAAANVAHHEEVQALCLPYRVHRDDVGVVQMRDGNGFTSESIGRPLIHEEGG